MGEKAKRRQFNRGYEGSWGKRQGPTPYSHLWTVIRKEALLRDGFVCQLKLPGCLGRATEADHIVAVKDGGGAHARELEGRLQTVS